MNQAAESVTRFSLDLYRQAASRTEGNLVLSPYSVAGTLLLLAEGARGETAREMGNVLRFPATAADPTNRKRPWVTSGPMHAFAELNRSLVDRDVPVTEAQRAELLELERQLNVVQSRIRPASPGFWRDDFATERDLVDQVNAWRTRLHEFEMMVANAAWVDERFPLRPEYSAAMTEHFGAGLFSVNFHKNADEARRRVNAWVAERTRNRIAAVLPPGLLTHETRLVLTNAVYFRGEWLHPFHEYLTKHEDFTSATGVTTKGPLMSISAEFRFAEFRPDGTLNELEKAPAPAGSFYAFAWKLPDNPDGVKVVEIPYKGDRLTFVALLPEKPEGITALEARLDAATLTHWLDRTVSQEVELYLPRFQLESMSDLKADLSALGMLSLLSPGGLTGISDGAESQFLSVTNLMHSVGIEVTEKGTIAVATTVPAAAAAGILPDPPKPPAVFRADHPFVFLIRDAKTGAILFIGRLANSHAAASQ
jgi:serine protease inhibitor